MTYIGTIKKLQPYQIFVFGSNTQGRHGKGAAKQAMLFGAVYGQARGLQGQSYAIVTKDLTQSVHPSIRPEEIISSIAELYRFAIDNKDTQFIIAYSGTKPNLNGYTPKDMASFFKIAANYLLIDSIPSNIIFEHEFFKLI